MIFLSYLISLLLDYSKRYLQNIYCKNIIFIFLNKLI